MTTYLPEGQCPHLPTDRGWTCGTAEHPPIVWCKDCHEHVEIGITHALRFDHDYALSCVFEHMVTGKYRAEHPREGELEVYAAFRHWKARHWDEVLVRVGRKEP